MLHHVQGNLLTSDCNVIGHQTNCMGVMGSGIAPQINKVFPLACRIYFADKRPPEEKLGTFLIGADTFVDVMHLYGQLGYGREKVQTNYTAFTSALDGALEKIISGYKNTTRKIKIGLPYLIGCGLGGGDWSIVEKIISDASEKHTVDIWLYEYTP